MRSETRATADARPESPRPVSRGSRRIAVVLNTGAGSADDVDLGQRIEAGLAEAASVHVFERTNGQELSDTLSEAIDWLSLYDGERDERVLVGAGGDGTINAAAQAAWEHGLVFGLLPAGTFNLIARSEGVGESVEEALPYLVRGSIVQRHVPLVNDRVFLANAGLGMYPLALEEREEVKQTFGRHRLVAMLAGIKTMISRFRLYRLRLAADEHDVDPATDQDGVNAAETGRVVVTPALFICANAMQLERLGVTAEPGLGRTHLVVISTRARGVFDLLTLAWRAMMGTLGQSDMVDQQRFSHMTVAPAIRRWKRRGRVSLDGEVQRLASPLRIGLSDRPLSMVMPLVTIKADEGEVSSSLGSTVSTPGGAGLALPA